MPWLPHQQSNARRAMDQGQWGRTENGSNMRFSDTRYVKKTTMRNYYDNIYYCMSEVAVIGGNYHRRLDVSRILRNVTGALQSDRLHQTQTVLCFHKEPIIATLLLDS